MGSFGDKEFLSIIKDLRCDSARNVDPRLGHIPTPIDNLGGDQHGPARGRCPRAERLVAAVPNGHWKTSTFIAAFRLTGLSAPIVVDGAMIGEIFLACVEQVLAPTLAPGDVMIFDNLSSWRAQGERTTIDTLWAILGDLLRHVAPQECANYFLNAG